jgi:hypothetical protein
MNVCSIGENLENLYLNAVAKYWSNAPLKTIAYDISDCNTWLNPWEMIYANEWCRNSVAIGMENTLRLAGYPESLTLQLILDRDIQEMLLVLNVDAKWILNYDWGTVKQYPKTNHNIIRAWRYDNKTYSIIG